MSEREKREIKERERKREIKERERKRERMCARERKSERWKIKKIFLRM